MSSAGYNEMLEKYRDVDEDEIMSGLTKDELARLENEIDREILEKPPDYGSGESESYTTATSSSDEADSEDEIQDRVIREETQRETEDVQMQTRPGSSPRGKPDAFARGKLDKTQLKPVQKFLPRQKSKDKHTFKLPQLKKSVTPKLDKKNSNENANDSLKNELLQAVKKREGKRRTKRGNSSGVTRRPSVPASKARRNSRIAKYRDGNEHQVDAAVVNRNFMTDELLNLRPRLKKVHVQEPKLVLPEELHGVSFDRITAGAIRKQEGDEEEEEDIEDDIEPEPATSEDGNASRNSTFGYDADVDVTPSDDSYLPGDDDNLPREKATSESSEAPSEGVITMASTASTSAESCDVFAGELSINPTSVEEMLERVRENDPILVEVNLNNIHDVPIERFEELAEAMKNNTHVTSLLLANTGLTDRAAKALGSMLKKNNTLKKLNVESNFITGDGGRRLVSALRKNDCLTELSLDNQRHIFGAKAEHDISKMMKENTSLLKFGYQFANPGLRMATSNILTKNMDIVRRKRVAEEKKRQQAGQSKRPQLRRQPSSEWYRRERLERLKKLQEQSKLLGLDPAKGIGDKEVERVLQNMSQDQVSLLERWFTSKLLGAVDKPPSTNETAQNNDNNAREHAKEQKSKKEPRRTSRNVKSGVPADNSQGNLLNPPTRVKRNKSPATSRDDLLDSIRKNNTRLKKVQLKPFESSGNLRSTDSDGEIQSTTKKCSNNRKNDGQRKSERDRFTEEANSQNVLTSTTSKSKNGKPPNHSESLSQVHVSADPSSFKLNSTAPKNENKSVAPPSQPSCASVKAKITSVSPQEAIAKIATIPNPTIMQTKTTHDESNSTKLCERVSPTTEISKEKCAARDAELSNEHIRNQAADEDESKRSSSPEIRDWKEGEEYDSDEYEIVEIEVTESEEESEHDTKSTLSNAHDTNSTEDGTGLPGNGCKPQAADRLTRQKPPPFSSISNEGASSPATLARDAMGDVRSPVRLHKDDYYATSASSSKSPPLLLRSSPASSQVSSKVTSPVMYGRSTSRDSGASSESAKSSPHPRPTTQRFAKRTAAAEDSNINPQALSTIESFFNFK